MDLNIILLILHVLGAGVMLGVAFFSAVATLNKKPLRDQINTVRFLGSYGLAASLWQVASGILLASSEWEEFSGSGIFWTKIFLYLVEGTISGMLISKKVKKLDQGHDVKGLPILLRINALVVIAIVVFGVLVANV